MTIAAGTRLGPYEIVAPLGAGGMGEVWRARDSRLERTVAIKILPQAFSANASSKLRFEREAKSISQLNHPNICALYDIGHDSGTDYLVMELVEGETLADRLSRSGPLPLPELIRYGSEIADALHAAHRQGIIHRDLKPGNVMLARSGAKLLDFGLAKARESATNPDGPTEMVTAHKPLTEEGMIVGTIQYMAPEQLTGAQADHRSDLFALGTVLYEMATGRRAFAGNTRSSVITAILSSQPAPLSSVQPLTPRGLERLIAACLVKDPEHRMQSAHDVAVQLRWLEAAGESAPLPARRRWLPWGLAAFSAIAALLTLAYFTARGQEETRAPLQPVRFTIEAPPQTSLVGIPALSPDGTRLVLSAQSADGSIMLWLRSLDRLDAQPLKGTEEVSFAFWSPDGRQIGFVARGKLWRLDTADGTTHAITDPLEEIPGGATWNRNGVIVFAPFATGGLHRVSASGGDAVPLPNTRPGETTVWPWFLPDDDHFLFRLASKESQGIYVGSLSSGERKLIAPATDIAMGRVAYAAGFIFYNREAALYAQPFDVKKLEVTGEAQKIADDVEFYAPGRAAFSVSQGGTLVFHPASEPTVEQLMFVDRTGRELARAGPVASYSMVRLSPDERRLLFSRWGAQNASWVLDIARGAVTRLSFERFSGFPVWTPDGRGVVYTAAVDRPPNLFHRRENGAVERLTTMALDHYPHDVTPDGKFVLADLNNPPKNLDIVAVPFARPNTPIPLVSTPFDESGPVVSPDGAWLAYESSESGSPQVYATRLFGGGERVQISSAQGNEPRWSRDGRHIYYVDLTGKQVMEVAVSVVAGELQPSIAQALFTYGSTNYDVTRDGRFLIAKPQLNPDAAPMTVILNWPATVR